MNAVCETRARRGREPWLIFVQKTNWLRFETTSLNWYPQSEVKLGHSEERKLGTVLFFIHPADTLPVSLTLSLRNGLCLSRSIRLLCQLVLPRYKGSIPLLPSFSHLSHQHHPLFPTQFPQLHQPLPLLLLYLIPSPLNFKPL